MVWSLGRAVVFGGVSEGVYLVDKHIHDAEQDFIPARMNTCVLCQRGRWSLMASSGRLQHYVPIKIITIVLVQRRDKWVGDGSTPIMEARRRHHASNHRSAPRSSLLRHLHDLHQG